MKNPNFILKILLYPLSLLYGFIVGVRNLLFDIKILKSKGFKIPIIAVGNITVGGTGKTPHIEYLIQLLQNDFKIATLSRGYKRKSKGFILADNNATAKQIGDEPMQIKRKFPNILVAVDKKRVNGVQNLLKHQSGKDLQVILLDDAYQHRYIKPGLSILLMDYNRLITRDHILPYGRLRESANEKVRANIIIVTKTPADMTPIQQRIITKEIDALPFQHLYFTTLSYGAVQPVFSQDTSVIKAQEILENKNIAILLVTGIANPKPLRDYLSKFSRQIKEIQFPDHYHFKTKDIKKIEREFKQIDATHKLIITTEKDATRFLEMNIESKVIQEAMFYIPLEIKFMGDKKEKFDNKILNYIKKNRRSSNLHQVINDE